MTDKTDTTTEINTKDSGNGTKPNILLYSSLSKVAAFVLGQTPAVADFDKARKMHKEHPKNRVYYDNYMAKLAVLETKISHAQRLLKDNITAWEEKYYTENGQLPQLDQYDSPMKTKVKKVQHAKALLMKFRS